MIKSLKKPIHINPYAAIVLGIVSIAGYFGYRQYQYNEAYKEGYRQTKEEIQIFSEIDKLPSAENVVFSGLKSIDCSQNPFDLSPAVKAVIDFTTNWNEDPANKNRHLIINYGEIHGAIAQNILFPLLEQNLLEAMPNEKLAIGIERRRDFLDYIGSQEIDAWDRYTQGGKWSCLLSYTSYTTVLSPSTDKLHQKFLFHVSDQNKAVVWFNDAAFDNDVERSTKSTLLNAFMPEGEQKLCPVSRKGFEYRNKVYATNTIEQLQHVNPRIILNHFGKAHLLGRQDLDAIKLIERAKPSLKYADTNHWHFHQFDIPYETSMHYLLSTENTSNKYDILTVFVDNSEEKTGLIPKPAQEALTKQFNVTGRISCIVIKGLSEEEYSDIPNEHKILEKIRKNSTQAEWIPRYNHPEAWYEALHNDMLQKWSEEKESFKAPQIQIPKFSR